MPRLPRGLLGIKKDPRNQILFSFQARQGEEWPSDEEDSDYSPGDTVEEDNDSRAGPSKKRQKKPGKKIPVKKKKARSTSPRKRSVVRKSRAEEDPDVMVGLAKVTRFEPTVAAKQFTGVLPPLPPEIWERIFHHVVKDDGALPFLDRAEKVCRLWRDVSASPKLWEKLDIRKCVAFGWEPKFSKQSFTKLCRTRLGACQNLNVSNGDFMAQPWAVQAIADHCPNLRNLNLSYCKRLPVGSLDKLVDSCKHLEDIDVSCTTADCISTQTIENLTKKCGANLKRLVLSHNMARSFNMYIKNLVSNCPNLEHLDVSNMKLTTDSITLDIEDLQRNFLHLRSLCISNTPVRASNASRQQQELAPGFPYLEELSLAAFNSNFVTVDFVTRMLKNAEKLRLLDLRGCVAPRVIESLEELVATNLEQLFLSRSGAQACFTLSDIVAKWRHSLTHLDLSWMTFKGNILEETLDVLCGDSPNTVLQHLDLTGTSVGMDSVRKLISSLPNLVDLQLSSCRDVDRGCKRDYRGQSEVQALRDTLNL